MTPQRFREIRVFFEEIVNLPPAQRSTALMQARRADPELAGEVGALIAAYSQCGDFIEDPLTLVDQRQGVPMQSGSIIGSYELQELVGIGGMGEVWRAEQIIRSAEPWL